MEITTIQVFIPLVNQNITLEVKTNCKISDIRKDLESRVQTEHPTLQTNEFALFPSIDKNIVNSSPPLEENILLNSLDQVKTYNKLSDILC